MRYIYLIQNNINYKVYVGQSKVPHKRWIRHQYDANVRKMNLPLYKSIRKHGIYNFSFYVIACLEDELTDKAETYWIQYFDSSDENYGYNLELGGCRNKIVSSETRAKQSVSSKKRYNAETTRRLADSKRTPQALQNASISSTGSKNGNSKINEQIVLEIRKLWNTGQYKQTELSIKLNLPKTTINHIIKRYTWKNI